MVKRKIEWIEILFWIFMIILFIMILTRIFGSSATDVQIYSVIFSALVSLMIFIAKHYRETGEIRMEMRYGFEEIKRSFNRVKEDMNRIEDKINQLSIRRKK